MAKVNLKEKPYYLNDEQIAWVEKTIDSMTLEEKIGQLFIGMTGGTNEEVLKGFLDRSKMGGMRYMNIPADMMWEQNYLAQKNSKIPLLIASNVESGGNGACSGGTNVGMEIKVASTGDTKYAYELGRICGKEGTAIGSNWAFSPIVDLCKNWRNTIVNTRTWGADADMVLEMSKAYYHGVKESNMVCAMKHFPGDGIDERDHHLSSSVNTLSVEEWNESFGKVYKGLIDEGVESVMVGHIMLPSWQKKLNPDMKDDEVMPASLCKELVIGLLREELGFNGLVVTDASHMVGMTGRMSRSLVVPTAIAAGCDMFLFFNDVEEDTQYMMDGYKNGIITDERLSDALHRILGLKASLGLWNKKSADEIMPPKEGIAVVGCEEHKAMAAEISDKAITLVKKVGDQPVPLSPETHRRIMLVPLGKQNPLLAMVGMGSAVDPMSLLKEELEKEGFEVTVYESPMGKMMEQIAKLPPEKVKEMLGAFMNGQGAYGGKESIQSFVEQYDAVITAANVSSSGTAHRITWAGGKGGWEIPYYVYDMPAIFVSFNCPFHLADVPQVKTYINCYDSEVHTVKALVQKLVGKSEFTGVSTVDAFCGMIDTRL